jgi:hypothetical protein
MMMMSDGFDLGGFPGGLGWGWCSWGFVLRFFGGLDCGFRGVGVI